MRLVQVDDEGVVEPQRGCDGRDNLANQPVEVGVAWPLNIQIPPTDVVDRLVVNHKSTVAVLQGGVRTQSGVVGLDHGSSNLRSWVDAELQLGLLAIVNRQAFHQQRGETRTSATTERVENQEPLKKF